MKMISYWKDHDVIYTDEEGQVIIIGWYDHFNQNDPRKALGIHWQDYPTSRGVLAPVVLSEKNANALLLGLLQNSVSNGKTEIIDNLIKAIEFLNKG